MINNRWVITVKENDDNSLLLALDIAYQKILDTYENNAKNATGPVGIINLFNSDTIMKRLLKYKTLIGKSLTYGQSKNRYIEQSATVCFFPDEFSLNLVEGVSKKEPCIIIINENNVEKMIELEGWRKATQATMYSTDNDNHIFAEVEPESVTAAKRSLFSLGVGNNSHLGYKSDKEEAKKLVRLIKRSGYLSSKEITFWSLGSKMYIRENGFEDMGVEGARWIKKEFDKM